MKKILFLFLSIFSWNLFANFEVITLGNSGGVVVGTTTSYIIRDTKWNFWNIYCWRKNNNILYYKRYKV